MAANLSRAFLSFVYQCIVVEDPNIKRGFGIPLSDFYVPVPSLDLDFQCHMSCFFSFSELMCVVTVPFVDIGGFVDHHHLKFLFIMLLVICMSRVIIISNIIENVKKGT